MQLSHSVSPEIAQDIVKNLVNSRKSSYQIAQNFHVPQYVVAKLGKEHLGDETFNLRETESLKELKAQIEKLQTENVSVNKISRLIGISRSVCYRLASKNNEKSDDFVQIVSLDAQVNNHKTLPSTSQAPNEFEFSEVKYRTDEVHLEEPVSKAVKLTVKGVTISFTATSTVEETVLAILNGLRL